MSESYLKFEIFCCRRKNVKIRIWILLFCLTFAFMVLLRPHDYSSSIRSEYFCDKKFLYFLLFLGFLKSFCNQLYLNTGVKEETFVPHSFNLGEKNTVLFPYRVIKFMRSFSFLLLFFVLFLSCCLHLYNWSLI